MSAMKVMRWWRGNPSHPVGQQVVGSQSEAVRLSAKWEDNNHYVTVAKATEAEIDRALPCYYGHEWHTGGERNGQPDTYCQVCGAEQK